MLMSMEAMPTTQPQNSKPSSTNKMRWHNTTCNSTKRNNEGWTRTRELRLSRGVPLSPRKDASQKK
jgi:hypothetical protein